MNKTHFMLLLLLVCSVVLRVLLALQGGQYMWPDESRYILSQRAVAALMSLDWLEAARYLCGRPFEIAPFWASPGIIWAGIIPALVEHALGESPVIPAVFYGLFSVLNIFLVFRILKHMGSEDREALLASFLMAIACSLFYYARNILSYDVSMTMCLLALLSGVARPESMKNSFWCGVCAALGFLAYNGYWTLAAVAMFLPFIYRRFTIKNLSKHALCTGLGFVIVFAVLVSCANAVDVDIVRSFKLFSRTVTSGVMSEGWLIPLAYYWHAEHFVFVLWLGAVLYFLLTMRKNISRKKVLFSLAAILIIYGSLVVFSVVLEKFVVYARIARQLTPFFCMLTAIMLNDMLKTAWLKKYAKIIIICALIQGGYNLYYPFSIAFMDDFEAKAESLIDEGNQYSMLYVKFSIYPLLYLPPLPPHKVVLEKRGPLNFYPWLYEGFPPFYRKQVKTIVKSMDTTMRLIQYDPPVSPPMPLYLP